MDIEKKLTDPNPFIDGPAEFLSKKVAIKLAEVKQFKGIFGDDIDTYMRMDYSMRQLPALRVYNVTFKKSYDSWFIEGDIENDVIWSPSLRRENMQDFQDILSSALLQQYRRPTFFNELCEECPGLNELGKVVAVDKGLGFNFGKDGQDPVPLTKISVNFRVDLREWDLYLEQTCRTKDEPFEKTLKELERIVAAVEGLNDDGTINVTVPLDQKI